MPVEAKLTTEALDPAQFDEFLAYLNDHLADNGAPGSGYFQPLARADSRVSEEKAQAFRAALQVPFSAPGWRVAWVARAPGLGIVGHVDLRAHPQRNTEPRCLLGMGVERRHRQRGLGANLITHAQQWALASTALEWIDLQVLSVNQTAIRLYHASGFSKTGEIKDCFEIDGQFFSYTSMSKKLVLE